MERIKIHALPGKNDTKIPHLNFKSFNGKNLDLSIRV
jgi:hypothetical protein